MVCYMRYDMMFGPFDDVMFWPWNECSALIIIFSPYMTLKAS